MNELGELVSSVLNEEGGGKGVTQINEYVTWWRGFWLLRLYEARATPADRSWLDFFGAHGVSSQTYTPSWVRRRKVVHVRLSHRSKHAYTGSTKKSVAGREATRTRVYRQKGREACLVEPAIKWWRKKRNFFAFTPVVLSSHSTYAEAYLHEVKATKSRQTSLNVPFVWALVGGGKAASQNKFRTAKKACRLSPRIWRRYRAKLHQGGHSGRPWVTYWPKSWPATLSQEDASLRMVVELGADRPGTEAKSSWGLEKWLRQSHVPPEQLYALHRVANQLGEPERGVAKGKIAAVMKKRCLVVPREVTAPFVFPGLRSPGFHALVKRFLGAVLSDLKDACLPFHAPKASLVEGKWVTVEQLLFTASQALQGFAPNRRPRCTCAALSPRTSPEARSGPVGEDGRSHVVASGVDFLGICKGAQSVALANSREAVLPSARRVAQALQPSVLRFCQRNQISLGPIGGQDGLAQRTQAFARQLHSEMGREVREGVLREADVRALGQVAPEAVWYCEDHKYTRVVAYCPALFDELVRKTYLENTEVFLLERLSAEDATRFVENSVPSEVRRRCQWAFGRVKKHKLKDKLKVLPTGGIIPKGKKRYTTARPFVSFHRNFLRRLHQSTGCAMRYMIAKVVGSAALDVPNTEAAVKRMAAFNLRLKRLARAGEVPEVKFDNSDLEGCFTSPPHDRLVKDCQEIVTRFRVMFPETEFIETGDRKNPHRRNTRSRKSRCSAPVPANLVVTIVRHSLECSVFTVGSVVFRQIRGSFIGSPLSPPLSIATVAMPELKFNETLTQYRPRGNTWESFRYVDNRFVAMVSRGGEALVPKVFLSADFYGNPVNLLPEPDLVCLGLQWGVTGGQIWAKFLVHGFEQIRQAAGEGRVVAVDKFFERWRYRTPMSCVSDRQLRAGCIGRLVSAARYALPVTHKREAVLQLFALFITLRLPPAQLTAALHHQQRRFRVVYEPIMKLIQSAVQRQDPINIATHVPP